MKLLKKLHLLSWSLADNFGFFACGRKEFLRAPHLGESLRLLLCWSVSQQLPYCSPHTESSKEGLGLASFLSHVITSNVRKVAADSSFSGLSRRPCPVRHGHLTSPQRAADQRGLTRSSWNQIECIISNQWEVNNSYYLSGLQETSNDQVI